MKLILIFFIALTSVVTNAKVVKSFDAVNSCDLYRATKTEAPEEVREDEVILLNRAVYGISIIDMDIDFRNEEVCFVPMINIVVGFDRPLVENRIILPASNKDFKTLINQVNKKLISFNELCLNSENKIVYAQIIKVE